LALLVGRPSSLRAKASFQARAGDNGPSTDPYSPLDCASSSPAFCFCSRLAEADSLLQQCAPSATPRMFRLSLLHLLLLSAPAWIQLPAHLRRGTFKAYWFLCCAFRSRLSCRSRRRLVGRHARVTSPCARSPIPSCARPRACVSGGGVFCLLFMHAPRDLPTFSFFSPLEIVAFASAALLALDLPALRRSFLSAHCFLKSAARAPAVSLAKHASLRGGSLARPHGAGPSTSFPRRRSRASDGLITASNPMVTAQPAYRRAAIHGPPNGAHHPSFALQDRRCRSSRLCTFSGNRGMT